MSNEIIVTYRIHPSNNSPGEIAKDIVVEQTIEMPINLVQDSSIRDNIVGKIISYNEINKTTWDVIISYNSSICENSISQLLNLLFGNISLKSNIKIIDIQLPSNFVNLFKGPRFSIKGLRKLSKKGNKPLIATALKPLGISPEILSDICFQFALGGVDLIKDDHSLANHSFCPFEKRVSACMEATYKAAQKTGKEALYFPNITGNIDTLLKNIDFAIRKKVPGIILNPFLIGFDLTLKIINDISGKMAILAHPAFAGNFFQKKHGFSEEILLGTFMRLLGFDGVIFPHWESRFPFSSSICKNICNLLNKELYNIAPAIPVPAGGISLDNLDSLIKNYGKDVIILVGGSLYSQSKKYQDNAKFFYQKIQCL